MVTNRVPSNLDVNQDCPADLPEPLSAKSKITAQNPPTNSLVSNATLIAATRGGFLLPALLFTSLGIGCAKTDKNEEKNECDESHPEINSEKSITLTEEDKDFIYYALDLIQATLKLTSEQQALFCDLKRFDIVDKIPELKKDGKKAGYYWNGVITIEYSTLKKHDFQALTTIIHEFGHHIHFNLSNEEWSEFKDICWNSSSSPKTENNEAYFESSIYNDFSSEEDPYGEEKAWEDFATFFAAYVLEIDYVKERTLTNTYVNQKLEFFKKILPRYDESEFSTIQAYPSETESINFYNPNNTLLDEMDGSTWLFFNRNTNTSSAVHLNKDGEIESTTDSNFFSFTAGQQSNIESDFEKIYNGELLQVGMIPYETDSSRSYIKILKTNLISGSQEEYVSSFLLSSKIKIIDYDFSERKLYYEQNGTLYLLNIDSDESIVFKSPDSEGEISDLTSTKDFIFYFEKTEIKNFNYSNEYTDMVQLFAFDKKTKLTKKFICPNNLTAGKIFSLESGRIAVLTGLSGALIEFDLSSGSFTSYDIDLTPLIEDWSGLTNLSHYLEWETGTNPVLRTLSQDYDTPNLWDNYLYNDQLGVVAADPSSPIFLESTSIIATPVSTDNVRLDLDYVVRDKDDDTIYYFTIGTDQLKINSYEFGSGESEFFEIDIPDSFPTGYKSPTFYSTEGRIFLSIIDGNDLLYYEIDLTDLSIQSTEKQIEEVEGYNAYIDAFQNGYYQDPETQLTYFLSYYSTHFSYEETEWSEFVIQSFNPDTGDSFELPPLPITDEKPNSVLTNKNLIYVIKNNWLIEFDTLAGKYTYFLPVTVKSSNPQNYLMHKNRPVFIGEKDENTNTYTITDLLSRVSLDFSTDDVSVRTFLSDGNFLYGLQDSWKTIQIDTMIISED